MVAVVIFYTSLSVLRYGGELSEWPIKCSRYTFKPPGLIAADGKY